MGLKQIKQKVTSSASVFEVSRRFRRSVGGDSALSSWEKSNVYTTAQPAVGDRHKKSNFLRQETYKTIENKRLSSVEKTQ